MWIHKDVYLCTRLLKIIRPMLVNTKITTTMQRLRHGEHAGFLSDIIVRAKTYIIAVLQLLPAWNIFEGVALHEDLLFRVSSESAETHLIEVEDKDRDRIFKEVKHCLKYNAEDRDSTIREAAEHLLFVLKPYDKAPSTNLFEETKYIQNFLGAINKPANQSAIAAIPGLSVALQKLEAANVNLDNLYQQRLQALEALAQMGKPADIRKDSDKAMITLFETINTVYDYNELVIKDASVKSNLESAANYIHALLAQVDRVLAGRSHPHSPKKPSETPPAKPPTPPTTPPTDPQNPNTTLPPAPNTPPQNPDTGKPNIDPDELNPPAVGEH